MRRREFITLVGGAAASWPLVARAQQSAMPVVGFLSGRSLASDSGLVAAFSRALNEAGYVNGQNVAIEFRWADGQLNRLPELAAELIERKVAVLFAGASDVAAGALRVAAATVPVVFATGSDPVAAGLVASFNRPGGNLTGVTVFSVALELKRLGLLRELISPTPLIALLVNPNNLTATAARRELNDATRRIGQDVVLLDASTEGELEAAFATLTQKRASALVVSDDALFANRRAVLVALAARHAIPAIYGRRDFAEAGGLISYGASIADQYYQSGVYVGRILKGAKPADLPFLQPTKFELAINLKTAKALGLSVPAVRCAAMDLMPVFAPTKYSIESLRCCLLSLGADMRRREFITLLGGVVTVWPLAARAQSVTIPEIGFLGTGSSEATINLVLAFSQGLSQAGFVEGQNVKIEYRWANNEYDRLSKLVEDFVRRQVAVIATPFSKAAATVAKRANTTIPVVFSIAGDPINLVSSPA